MQDLTPLRPAFWNVPLWAEIGVYVIGIAAVVLCIAGIVRAVKQRQATTQPEPLADRNARLGRTLLEVFWQKRIRDTAAGKNRSFRPSFPPERAADGAGRISAA